MNHLPLQGVSSVIFFQGHRRRQIHMHRLFFLIRTWPWERLPKKTTATDMRTKFQCRCRQTILYMYAGYFCAFISYVGYSCLAPYVSYPNMNFYKYVDWSTIHYWCFYPIEITINFVEYRYSYQLGKMFIHFSKKYASYNLINAT